MKFQRTKSKYFPVRAETAIQQSESHGECIGKSPSQKQESQFGRSSIDYFQNKKENPNLKTNPSNSHYISHNSPPESRCNQNQKTLASLPAAIVSLNSKINTNLQELDKANKIGDLKELKVYKDFKKSLKNSNKKKRKASSVHSLSHEKN